MKPDLLSGLEAAASGARLSGVEMVPDFPMPAVFKIVDKLRDCGIIDVESQSSAITAAMGAVACDKRAFLAIDGVHAFQEFCTAAFMRMPIVAVGTTLALRDSGWLIFMPESNQEILDTVIQAYKICEDNNVLLPGFIRIDFPELREPVLVPKEQSIRGFLPHLRLHNKIDTKNPMAIGIRDRPELALELKAQQQKAMENSLRIMHKINEKWKKKFKRSYDLVERYRMEDADKVLVVAGSDSLTAKTAIDRLREQGENVGLLRLRIIRPLPVNEIGDLLKGVKHVAVVDRDVSVGSAGILYKEIREFYDGPCYNFIGSRLREEDFINILRQISNNIDKPERFWFI